jgi:hypothetical protein
VPVIELRAGIIVGPGSAAFEVMRDLVLNLPVMITPRWVQAKSPPIALDNLLEYLVRLPSVPEAQGRIFDAGGPEVITYAEMMKRLAVAAGRRRPWIIPVPVLTPTLSSYWLRLVTAVPTPIARALIGGLKHDFHADDASCGASCRSACSTSTSRSRRFSRPSGATRCRRAGPRAPSRCAATASSTPITPSARAAAADTDAPPEAAWKVVEAIGGGNRYYCSGWMWWLREVLDWTIGGPGRNRGRRDPETLRVGDRVDSWHVIGLEPGRRLTLMMGMKAPGAGVLEFEVEPRPSGGARVAATAYWHPAGVWGLAYWYTLVPAHLFIFKCMTSSICRRAEGR